MSVKAKSFDYQVDVTWTEQKKGMLQVAGKPPLEVATPPEFKGHPGIWSPEDLIVAAAASCLMTTFLAYAERANIKLAGYKTQASGSVAWQEGGLAFTKIALAPTLVVGDPSQVDLVREMIVKAKNNCLVANSMKAQIELVEPEITTV